MKRVVILQQQNTTQTQRTDALIDVLTRD